MPQNTQTRYQISWPTFKLSKKCPKQVGTMQPLLMTKVLDAGDSSILKPAHGNLKKKIELYQEAMAQGLEFKLKNKNQPFCATSTQQKHRYCFSYNSNGFCKAKGCPHPHVCQICAIRHHKRQCPKFRQNNKLLSQTLNKAKTLAQTHRSQLESFDSIVTPINVQQLQNYLSGFNQATSDF